MSGWLYLIRNRDLYKIGITRNFDKRMQQLKPDVVVSKLYTNEFIKLEKELHNRYKKYRIPQSEYFRLEDSHLEEIKIRISQSGYPISITIWLFTKSFLFVLLIFFLVFTFISLNTNEINMILIKSIIWMERFSFAFSFLSLFLHSGKYLSFFSELKYRVSRLIIFVLFFSKVRFD